MRAKRYGTGAIRCPNRLSRDLRPRPELSVQRVADGEQGGWLLALAGRLPAPILAERLGIHQARAAQWVRTAGASYSGYVELRLARDVGDVP
jgi:hypothetical protein